MEEGSPRIGCFVEESMVHSRPIPIFQVVLHNGHTSTCIHRNCISHALVIADISVGSFHCMLLRVSQ